MTTSGGVELLPTGIFDSEFSAVAQVHLPNLYIAESFVDLGVDKEQSLTDLPVSLLSLLKGMVRGHIR